MRKMYMSLICAIALLFGLFGSVQTYAATVEKSEVHGRGHFKHDPEFIKKKAESLGIDSNGKDLEALAKEVWETEIKKDAKELGIATEGKDLHGLAREIHETQIKKDAKELGISTDNKDFHTIAHEVREKRIFQAAEKLGIETKNKSADELFKEIITNHADKAKELNLFPRKGGKLHFFDKSKEH
ncbi:hypothetical protein ACIQAA_25765 [Neobacillus sp. NPDC093182]|uniref:hypothetical protein n=1 Tax=Neobacillus sp. NPDC093182 TaxID=3364297 RepID=UPI003804053F